MKLAIVSSYFNPCGYQRLRDNVRRFVDGLGGASERLYMVALTMDGEDGADFELQSNGVHLTHVSGRQPANTLWQKERLLNHAIKNLPPEYDAVAWVDADILFHDSGWVEQAEQFLHEFAVIQLFKMCNQLGPRGIIERTRFALAHNYDAPNAAWGMAWAARRDVVQDGLLDWAITGAGDAFMADAWMARRRPASKMSAPMGRIYRPWAERQRTITGGVVGHLPGTIDHLWHGSMLNRRYHHRNQILVKYHFDPEVDVVADGPLYRWANPDGQLASAVIEWFGSRQEDG